MSTEKQIIQDGQSILGIEFGSTRIKATLIDSDGNLLAQGGHQWENRLEDGIWTYHMEDITEGLQDCYRGLCEDVHNRYQIRLTRLAALGISGMMHGYLAFDKNGHLLVPFRTWRNTCTEEAACRLTQEFSFHIPQRWSIAHLYQAILNQEDHVQYIDHITTLAGYIHSRLTGQHVVGIGEASGMFPIDSSTRNYDTTMKEKFDQLILDCHYPWRLADILPEIKSAGESAGVLTSEGAAFLDPSGSLEPGCPMCPPEGDAGTGMVATNSTRLRTGNISAGTSDFAMVVLEHPLISVHDEIDIVTTPVGDSVAMVHCNNFTSDLNAWAGIFREFAKASGHPINDSDLFPLLFQQAMEGAPDCGGLLGYNYFSGEPITKMESGCPVFLRRTDSTFSLANFMRSHIYSALATLKIGMDILLKEEQISLDRILGHGGFYKTPIVGQQMTADALNTPVSVISNAGEGGSWGMAILAAYLLYRQESSDTTDHASHSSVTDSKESSVPSDQLSEYLDRKIFVHCESSTLNPLPDGVAGFEHYIENYKKGLEIERFATKL